MNVIICSINSKYYNFADALNEIYRLLKFFIPFDLTEHCLAQCQILKKSFEQII